MEENFELLNKIPKKYHKAIKAIYKDCDGYWAHIGNGYKVEDYLAEHTIHEDTLIGFKQVFRHITKE